MNPRSTTILVTLCLLLAAVSLLVAYSGGESHGEGMPQNHGLSPTSTTGPSAPTASDRGVHPPLTTGPPESTASDHSASRTVPFPNTVNAPFPNTLEPSVVPSPSSSDSTADILLAQQIVTTAAGGGPGGNCLHNDVSTGPAAYINNFPPRNYPKIDLDGYVGVCLRGFDPAAPVMLTVDVGDHSYQTEIRMTDDEVRDDPEDFDILTRPEPIFDGVPLTASHLSGEDAYRTSAVWDFFPPEEVRDSIVSVVLTASQGELSSQVVQPVNVDEPGEKLISDGVKFAVWGFPVGRRVEIGLYRNSGEFYSLVRRVGVVTMPASVITVFTIPEDVLQEAARGNDGDYCLSAPLEMATQCRL